VKKLKNAKVLRTSMESDARWDITKMGKKPMSGCEERGKVPGGPVGLTAKERVIRETHASVKGKVLEVKPRWIQVSVALSS